MCSRQSVTKGRKGFTLLELLVVMVVIAMLIAITLSVASHAKQQAKQRQAEAEARGLVTAIRAYKVVYDRWPGNPAGGTWGANNDNQKLIYALTAKDTTSNTQGRNFIEVADPDRSYYDPWGTNYQGSNYLIAYRINIDSANNRVRVWSVGPNGTNGGGDDVEFAESIGQ